MTDFSMTIDAARLAMGVEETRAKVAAYNIATANAPGARPLTLEVSEALAALRAARGDAASFQQALQHLAPGELAALTRPRAPAAVLSMDSEVADMSAASGRYQALADGVSRQFALMQLALRGGR